MTINASGLSSHDANMGSCAASGGLIGATGSAFRRSSAILSNHDGLAIRLVFFAGIITILHKSKAYEIHWGELPPYAVVFAVCLGIAALLYEMNATTYALRAFWNGRLVGTLGWSAIWIVAFAYSMNQWVGAASETEGAKSNVHKAAFHQTVDTRKAKETAQKTVDRLEQKLVMAPIRTPDAAQAAIDNAKANRFWKATNECKETKGPQTRQFCSDYASAVADKAGATEAIALREELKLAKAELGNASKAVAGTKVEVSESRNDLVILTKYAGMAEDDARTFNAIGSIIAISIFLSLATALRELEHLRATQKRVPMFPVRQWYGALYKFLTGKDLGPGNTLVIDEGHFKAVRQSLGQAMRTA